jgi:DNA replication protein DnaC
MNTTETLHLMQELRLHGMHNTYRSQLEQPMNRQLDTHEMVGRLVEAEMLNRSEERTAYYLKLARLRQPALPEQVECSAARNLTKQQLGLLLEGQYLNNAQNVLIVGPTGCGKSFLACALGHHACTYGHKTAYFNMNRFIEKMTLARLDGSFIKLLNHLERQSLIILDDFGLQPLNHDMRLALLQLLEDRYGRKSIIVVSQLPVSKWHDYINEPTMADAILDRLTANAHRVELKGESMRRKKTTKSD